MRESPAFVRVGAHLVNVRNVTSIDCTRLEDLEVAVHHHDGAAHRVGVATGADAIDAVMLLRPSALEGRPLRFLRHAWAVHNLVGHPLMQLLVWAGLRRLALTVHDATVPRPRETIRA